VGTESIIGKMLEAVCIQLRNSTAESDIYCHSMLHLHPA